MNTPKFVHARGSLHVKIINSKQGDSFFTRHLAFRVQTNNILFHSPEDGGGWSDFHDLLRRWFSDTKGIKVSGTGQISLDALPATPLPAFYGLELGYTPDKITLSVQKKESFASGAQLEFSAFSLEISDERTKALVEVSGAVNLAYRGQHPLTLSASLDASEGLRFFLPLRGPGSLKNDHPFLADFSMSQLKVVSKIKRWEGLQVLYTFGEGEGNLLYDYAGSGDEQNLRIVNRNQVAWSKEGLTLKVNYSNLSKNPRITAEKNARNLVEACQRTHEISIEAWIKTSEIRQVGPAEIISLEKNERKRNFALGQGPEEKVSKGRTARSVGNFLNTRISTTETDRDGEPGMQTPSNSFGVIHSHVVFTRDKRGNAATYINGVCCKTGKISGSFEDWEEDVKLIIGNDTKGTGPWAGELYQLAIYNQALSEEEVRAHYAPHVYLEGEALLTPVPPPLDQPLAAVWEINPDSSTLDLKGAHKILSPQFHFEDIALSLHIDSQGKMTPSGNIKTALWGNLFNLVPSKTGGGKAAWPTLTMHSPGITTFFDFDGLGRVSMQKLKFLPGKSPGAPKALTWKVDDIAGITLHDFPDVVDGISTLDLDFVKQEVWLSITDHNHSFSFIQDLLIKERAEKFSLGKGSYRFGPMQITRELGEWAVMPLKDRKTVVGKSSLGKSLSSHHADSLAHLIQPPEVVKDPKHANKQLSLFLGKWELGKNQADLRLAVGFMKRIGNGFSFETELDKNDKEPAYIHMFGEGCFMFGDLTHSPVKIEGVCTFNLLNEQGTVLNKIFKGNIQLNEKGDRLLMFGDLSLFPDWSAVSVQGPGTFSVSASNAFSLDESIQFSMEDFKLLEPRLKINKGNIQLSGKWLGEDRLTFSGTRHGEPTQTRSFALKSSAKFQGLPFQFTVDPIFDPKTGDKLAEGFTVCQGKDCCAFMNIDMDIELSERGFHSKVRANFKRIDENNQEHPVSIPEFQLFWPPRTRNELLSLVLEELRTNASEIFTPQFKTEESYFLEKVSDLGILRYGLSASSGGALETIVPEVFSKKPAKNITSAASMFALKANSKLEISVPAGASPKEVKTDYASFLGNLESITGNLPKEGSISLVQARIAERLAMSIEDALFYHYGLDKTQNQVDIKPGMRLRVEYQNYQFVPRSEKRAIQGFVGSGSGLYEVNHFQSGGSTKLSFDPFLTGMEMKISGVNGSNSTGGLLDLSTSQLKAFYRLKFPPEFADTSINRDVFRATQLIGADSYGDLDDGSSILKRNFLGRAIIIPEILVYVNQRLVYIPLGTTLRQLLERSSGLPATGFFTENAPSASILAPSFKMNRLVHEGLNSKPVYKSVDLGAYATFTSGADLFDLPLVKGDRINF